MAQVRSALVKKKGLLLKGVVKKSTTQVFINHCILPRLLFSPEDALFCAKFAALLHDVGTPGFSSIQYYDKVAREVSALLNCVTRSEATNLGVFLLETLTLLTRWRSSSRIYDKEVGAGMQWQHRSDGVVTLHVLAMSVRARVCG